MPYTIRLLEDGRGILAQGSGTVTLEEIERAKQEFIRSGELKSPIAYLIVDGTGASASDFSGADIRRVAESTTRLSPSLFSPGARAAVVAPTDMLFGVARMWEVFVEGAGMEVQVFRSREDAEPWVTARGSSGEESDLK